MTKLPAAGAPILVVSHEASRTGAPRAAIEVVRSLESLGLRRIVILRWPGPLRGQFEEAADQVLLEPLRRARVLLRSRRRTRRLAVGVEELAAAWLLLRHRPRLVYLNTVKSACYVRPALRMGVSVVLHVHELEALASTTLGRYRLDGLYGRIQLVACSDEVRGDVVRITGVADGEVAVIRSSVDAALVLKQAEAPCARLAPPGALVVGACGLANAGKGVDLWLDMAARIRSQGTAAPIHFVWVGRPSLPGLSERLRVLGLEGAVHMTGEVDNPYPYIAAMDVFTNPARQEAFGLAVQEAMLLGRPVVASAVGGVPEQVGDAGVLVPAGDAEALAVAVLALAADPTRRAELGALAKARATTGPGIDGFRSAVRDLVRARLGV